MALCSCSRVWSPRISSTRLITLLANFSLVGPPTRKTVRTYRFAGGAAWLTVGVAAGRLALVAVAGLRAGLRLFHGGIWSSGTSTSSERGWPGWRRISPFRSSIFTIWFTDGGETHMAAAISDSAG